MLQLDRWLGRERIIAGPGFNRWLIPPAALAIHLCIGMAASAHESAAASGMAPQKGSVSLDGGFSPAVVLAWLGVGLPLLWGIWITLTKAMPLFGMR